MNKKRVSKAYIWNPIVQSFLEQVNGGSFHNWCWQPIPYIYHSLVEETLECQRGLATRKVSICLSERPSLRLSVCLSFKLEDCDKTEERSVQILYHNTKDHLT